MLLRWGRSLRVHIRSNRLPRRTSSGEGHHNDLTMTAVRVHFPPIDHGALDRVCFGCRGDSATVSVSHSRAIRPTDAERHDDRAGAHTEHAGLSSQRFVLTLLCVVTALSLATRGSAADFELQGGFSTDVGTSTYSFLQLRVETPLGEKFGFLAELTPSFLTFKSREEDTTVLAEAPGVTELIGLRYHLTDTTTISLLAGGQEKETRFFGAHVRFRNDDGFVAKAEFYSQLNPTTELTVVYRYSASETAHYILMTPKHALFRFGSRQQFSFDVGVEASAVVSTDFDQEQGALVLGVTHRPTNTSLQFVAGAARYTSGTERGLLPHVGVGFFASF
jgi:opacity protein-like surface antigen